jgi:hypothetical protein
MDTRYRNGIPSSRSRIAVNQFHLPRRPLLGYMILVHCCILRAAVSSRESRRGLLARYPQPKPARCDPKAGFTLYATDESCRRSALEQIGHSLERRLYVLVRRWCCLSSSRGRHVVRHCQRCRDDRVCEPNRAANAFSTAVLESRSTLSKVFRPSQAVVTAGRA